MSSRPHQVYLRPQVGADLPFLAEKPTQYLIRMISMSGTIKRNVADKGITKYSFADQGSLCRALFSTQQRFRKGNLCMRQRSVLQELSYCKNRCRKVASTNQLAPFAERKVSGAAATRFVYRFVEPYEACLTSKMSNFRVFFAIYAFFCVINSALADCASTGPFCGSTSDSLSYSLSVRFSMD
jgi:ribosomal protein S14